MLYIQCTTQADFKIWTLSEDKDQFLFNKITTMKNHPSQDLLLPKWTWILRTTGNEFQLPQIRNEIYKNLFMNRCLFKLVWSYSITSDYSFLSLFISCSFITCSLYYSWFLTVKADFFNTQFIIIIIIIIKYAPYFYLYHTKCPLKLNYKPQFEISKSKYSNH